MDYIEIGAVPYEEDCQQVGTVGYNAVLAKAEAQAFANQLKRIWPDGDFRIKSNPHDFGSYYEVRAYYDQNDEHLTNIAYEAESNTPATWDAVARKELGL